MRILREVQWLYAMCVGKAWKRGGEFALLEHCLYPMRMDGQ